MGKSKKSFWKQMYLSNGWAIDRIIIPAGFIIFFFVVGFLTNIIFGIPESVKVDNGTSYYVNLIGWYFLSGFSVTALLVTFCLFIYYVPKHLLFPDIVNCLFRKRSYSLPKIIMFLPTLILTLLI